MSDTRWSSLSSFCVEYPPGKSSNHLKILLLLTPVLISLDDKIGHFLAYVSLTPFVVIVSFVTLGINNREVPTVSYLISVS